MRLLDPFLIFWLRYARLPWSRFRRGLFERRYLGTDLPSHATLQDIANSVRLVTWTQDSILHLFDSISYPETVWHKKRDDCDGFAVLAANFLASWDPSTEPVLLTTMVHPVAESHTVCAFKYDGKLRFFDNYTLRTEELDTHEQVALKVAERGQRFVCWDLVDPVTLQVREYHRVASE